MGYIFNHNDARQYEQYLNHPEIRSSTELEQEMMLRMLKPFRGKRILDIGCGTGSNLMPFMAAGLELTGIDPSPEMLETASNLLGHRAELYPGVAEDLPFDDNSFHYACLNKTLEFVENPEQAIEEACRVAKDMVFIGIMNRYSLKTTGMRIRRLFAQTFYDKARFFSIFEAKYLIRMVIGDIPLKWRSVCQIPNPSGRISRSIERFYPIQFLPFGAYVGIVITLVPRYRTTPLVLPCHPEWQGCGALTSNYPGKYTFHSKRQNIIKALSDRVPPPASALNNGDNAE